MERYIRKNKGITLIALVITIIVLLILTGVVIASLMGENGLLSRATGAKDNSKKAEIIENVKLRILDKITEKQGKDLTEEEIKAILEEYFINTNGEIDEIELTEEESMTETLTAKEGNYQISIKELMVGVQVAEEGTGGKIEFAVSETTGETTTISKSSISGNKALSAHYGKNTNYESVTGVTWQLFYDDDSYIYLIASDYIPANTIPSELLLVDQSTDLYRKFADYANTIYKGTIMETEPWSNGINANTFTENAVVSHVTNNYLKFINSNLASATDNPNFKAVAYMMDTNIWSDFAGNATGAYAIGGPTVELFVLSYNEKHDQKLGTYETIIDASQDSVNGNVTSNGYKIKLGTGSWSYDAYGIDTTGTGGNMWVKTSSAKASGYWIASPSAYSSARSIFVNLWGSLTYNYINSADAHGGFRPVIIIPKRSIK